MPLDIDGYDVDRVVHRSARFTFHGGRRATDQAPVLIKTPTGRNAEPYSDRLEWEYELTRTLRVDGVLAAYDLIRSGSVCSLILEDIGALPLRQLLDQHDPGALPPIELAARLASILGAVHQQGVTHKAINPCNVFVHPGTGRVVLTGFETASRLAGEQGGRIDLSLEALAYLAPEQTGRINRRVSHQADLYSLGVLLYEVFTHRLPFEAGDPLELIHAHLAVQPAPPSDVRPAVPQPVSDIVMKLLSKAIEDRYQTARGLCADLEACRDGRAVPGFVPGREDVPDHLAFPHKLYGRAGEVETLLSAFERVSRGGAEVLLVSGYSGIGKSALVHEVHKPILRERGRFISGKFDQFKRNIPHSAIVAAFQELSQQILTEREGDLSTWRDRISEALGDNGQVIVDVIPELGLIVGPQPPVPHLPPAEARNRFNLVFERFIKVFARDGHPLVVFLDDLQWADAATLDLLQSLASDPNLRYLLLIGAYRDNEVRPGHPLLQAVSSIEAATTPVGRILLAPLRFDDVLQLVADTLRCPVDAATPLAKLVYRKTAGNPFFVIQFVQVLQREGVLVFDHLGGRWDYDVAAADAMGITDNVVDLMVRKIEQLPDAAQEMVKLAACIGNRFDLHALAVASAVSHDEAGADLRHAVLDGLIVPISDAGIRLAEFSRPPTIQDPKSAEFRFLHDRVQQGAYALIPDDRKQLVHLRVGRLLLQHSTDDSLEEQLFEIVGHLNTGSALITDEADRLRLIELNLRAGRKAKRSAAFEPALGYLNEGVRHLPTDAWTVHYDLAFAFHLERAECAYLCGEFDQAEAQLEDLLARAQSPLEKAEIYRIRMVQYENTSRFAEARDWGKAGLALFGIVFPDREDSREQMLRGEIEAIDAIVGDREVEQLVDLPVMTDDAMRSSMKLLMTMWAPSYISGDMMLTTLIAAKMTHLSVRYGNVEDSAYGYVTYAARVALGNGDFAKSLAYGRLALAVNEKFDDLTARAKVNHMFSCYIQVWHGAIASCFRYSREAYRAGLASGDFIYAAYGQYHESWHALFSGQPLPEYCDQYQPNLAFLARTKNQTFYQAHQQVLHLALALRGRTERPTSLTSPEFDEDAYMATVGQLGFFGSIYHVCKLQLQYLFGEYDEAAHAARNAQHLAAQTEGMIWDAWRAFYHALTLTAQRHAQGEGLAPTTRRQLDDLRECLQAWAATSPESFSHRHALVVGEVASLQGDVDQAMRGYELAIARAAEYGCLHVEALAKERYGHFWLRRGNPEVARMYLAAARDDYTKWGATTKAAQLERAHGTDVLGGSRTAGAREADLDVTTVMRAAQLISGEVEQPQLLAKLLRIVLENAGAQRGSLLLARDGHLVIEAEGTAEGDVTLLQATPAETSGRIAASVARYVSRVGEHVVLADAAADQRFSNDPYVQANQPKSLLCTPILHQGRPIGLLYLENNLVRGAFTRDRIEVVSLLASQAAISLANARLYDAMKVEVAERKHAEEALKRAHDDLEVRVAQRTDELARANERLQQEVAERRQVEVKLQAAKETAETANRAKSEFLASMSHELRTPLNAILGYSQILRDDQLSEAQRRGIITIQRSGEHLLTLIDDVLALSRIEAGKLELAPSDFHVGAFLEHIVDIVRVRADQRGLAFVYEPVPALPTAVRGDERRLRQVLLNLLGNAIKFTDRGGVRFRVRAEPANPPRLCFEVEDTGIGVPSDKLKEIFEPFQQVHGSDDRPADGTGLGLAISKRLADLMGGSIRVDSTVGAGSRFTFEVALPEAAHVDASDRSPRVVGFSGDARRILVVDDKAENRAVLVGLLAPLGFELAEAEDGEDAVEKTRVWHPHLILMDLVMPVLDGFEATRRLRRDPSLAGIVILALSASVFQHSRERSAAAGCDDFIPKPVSAELLLEKLGAFLHLEWLYDDASHDTTGSSEPEVLRPLRPEPVRLPPVDVLRRLRQLAQQGDVRDLAQQLTSLEEQDPACRSLVEELRRYAEAYDMQQISDVVGAHLDQLE